MELCGRQPSAWCRWSIDMYWLFMVSSNDIVLAFSSSLSLSCCPSARLILLRSWSASSCSVGTSHSLSVLASSAAPPQAFPSDFAQAPSQAQEQQPQQTVSA
eukprot:CAMPEP_0206220128 /NCGR_PEP_ID=MMETSP0047_2-20121206/4714_1 /ASSEMBLY_ACC=CAM_ASM_000192 /TAXON_ID=195065 /ORGANISM="Chroomonas mesostigmatica_cf, Strain CCMP1168" /LENGTH=101 /DNA_ID=CAMNT_0053642771 /DNA_START=371 /DNA_END=673 /DNA_ORIENTATION=-